MRGYFRYNNLGKIIDASKCPVVEIADRANINARSLHRYINGSSVPSIKVAIRLAKVLQVSVYDLFDKPWETVKLHPIRTISICREDTPYNNIGKFTQARGLTPFKLAKLAGIKERSAYNYCNGETVPNVIDAITIANILRTTVYALFDQPFFV